jgi:hypothetical protein
MATTVTFQNSIEISASPVRVWDLTVAVEKLPELTPTVTAVERLDSGPLAVGSQARLTQPRQRPRVWTVETMDAPRTFVWSAPLGRMTMRARHNISATATGCRNDLGIELSGRGARVVGWLIGRQVRRALAQENDGFRRAAEAAGSD